MTYEETLNFLYTSTPVFEQVGASAYKPGLGTSLALDAYYEHPHRQYLTIHVAGTNGKGSVSHTLAAILQAKGLNVGLYTSPHLVDFSERIRVNGQPISHDYVVDFVAQLPPLVAEKGASFFELTTAMAFRYFADCHVDVAVIEVGLGGRLDSTNIITPSLSVITNISMDHTNLLGNTLEAIAHEKAGIIKHGVPVVIGETTPETEAVFLEKAQQEQAPIFFAEEDNSSVDYDFELKGSYQQRNLCTILTAVRHLPHSLQPTEQQLTYALQHVCELTQLQGRWQTLSQQPRIICDTGHNLAAWEYLSRQLTAEIHESRDKETYDLPIDNLQFPSTSNVQRSSFNVLHLVFGMVDDKDIEAVLALLPKQARFYWTQAQTHRAIPAKRVQEMAAKQGLHGNAYPTVAQTFAAARAAATPNDTIFIGGSSYVVADLLKTLNVEGNCKLSIGKS